MDMTQENINLKKEVNRFVARFFYGKKRTPELLALAYYLLDDAMKFMEEAQVKVGQEMLDSDYDEVFLEDRDVKVYHDNELHCILIDPMTKAEHNKLIAARNAEYTKGL